MDISRTLFWIDMREVEAKSRPQTCASYTIPEHVFSVAGEHVFLLVDGLEVLRWVVRVSVVSTWMAGPTGSQQMPKALHCFP